MRVAIGADHAWYQLKEELAAGRGTSGYERDRPRDLLLTDPVDYPDIASAVGEAVRDGRADRGVLVCGSGAGRR